MFQYKGKRRRNRRLYFIPQALFQFLQEKAADSIPRGNGGLTGHPLRDSINFTIFQ